MEILKQAQYSPMDVEKQIAIIYCGTKGLLKNVPINKIRKFEEEFLTIMELNHKNVLDSLKSGKITDIDTSTIENIAAQVAEKYNM